MLDAGAGAITFARTLDGVYRLDANTTGTTTFGGAVGTKALARAPRDECRRHDGDQRRLGEDGQRGQPGLQRRGECSVPNTVLDAGDGAITFASTLDGAFTLAANTTGTTTFGGAVGGTTAGEPDDGQGRHDGDQRRVGEDQRHAAVQRRGDARRQRLIHRLRRHLWLDAAGIFQDAVDRRRCHGSLVRRQRRHEPATAGRDRREERGVVTVSGDVFSTGPVAIRSSGFGITMTDGAVIDAGAGTILLHAAGTSPSPA